MVEGISVAKKFKYQLISMPRPWPWVFASAVARNWRRQDLHSMRFSEWCSSFARPGEARCRLPGFLGPLRERWASLRPASPRIARLSQYVPTRNNTPSGPASPFWGKQARERCWSAASSWSWARRGTARVTKITFESYNVYRYSYCFIDFLTWELGNHVEMRRKRLKKKGWEGS